MYYLERKCTVDGVFLFHSIIESLKGLGCEVKFKSRLVQCPRNAFQLEHFHLYQVAQTPVQPDLEDFCGESIHHLSGQPVPVFHRTHYKSLVP